MVIVLFFSVPLVGLQFVILVFSDHTHFLSFINVINDIFQNYMRVYHECEGRIEKCVPKYQGLIVDRSLV